MEVLVQLVLVPVPLSVSVATPPPSAKAFVGEVWKPLLSPEPEVTAACPLGLTQPVLFPAGWVGVGVNVGVFVRVGVEVFVAEGVTVTVPGEPVAVGVSVICTPEISP